MSEFLTPWIKLNETDGEPKQEHLSSKAVVVFIIYEENGEGYQDYVLAYYFKADVEKTKDDGWFTLAEGEKIENATHYLPLNKPRKGESHE